MHHPSWLFPGTCNPRRRDSTFNDISANGNNNSSGGPTRFEINSFVRSLNRNGIQLPENLILKSNGLKEAYNNSQKHEKIRDDKVHKSINDFLSILNDSVDRVVGIQSGHRSDSSSFENFRSTNEDRDTAAWNDLIQLVSTTAHEFRNIKTTGNSMSDAQHDCSAGSVRIENVGGRKFLPNHSRWTYDQFRNNQEADRAPQPRLKTSRDYGIDCENSRLSGEATIRKIDLDVTPTNDGRRHPRLVEIHSDLRGSNDERVQSCGKFLREIGHSETPKHFVNEILRATGNSKDQNSPAWITCNRRINFEDDLWPAAFAMTSNSDFPPYFTGGLNKAFDFRSKIAMNSKRFMNVSRSSPIFVDAGEAIAEPSLDILAQEHMIPDRCNADREEEHRIDFRPIKLDKKVANPENVDSKSSNHKESFDIEAKLPPHASEEKKISSSTYKNGADGKKIRRAKLVVKRGRKIGKQLSKRNDKKNASETEDEDDSDEKTESIAQSPRTPMQRFIEESCQARGGNETTGRTKNENFVESQMRIVTKIRNPTGNHFARKQVRPVAKSPTSNRLVNTDRNKKDFQKVIERPSLTNTRNSVSSKRLDVKCICDKTNGNPDPNAKVASSSNIPGNFGQSRSIQCTVSQHPKRNTALPHSAIRNSEVSHISFDRSHNFPFKTQRLQRPSTANEISQNRVPEVQTQGKTMKPSNTRGTSGDRKKSFKNNGTSASGTNHETNIPALRSKTFVHQMRRESSIRCIAVKEDCSTAVSERPSSKSMLNSTASGPMKQLYRKPWKNLSRVQRDADFSSETNLDDTPVDSRINTDTELSVSVSVASNSNSKNGTCNVKDLIVRERGLNRVLDANNEANNKFQNKHARSLKMLKSILSHQGVNVEGVNRDAKEIRSRISNDSSKKSQVPICTGRKRSSPLPQTDKNSPNTSRTLFEKLAILAEPQAEKLGPIIPATEGPSEKLSSFTNLESDSIMSCAKSTKDDAEQCSIDYTSTMISETSVHLSKSNCSEDPQIGGSSMNQQTSVVFVDASVSPLPSVTDFSKLKSSKPCEVATTQTQSNVVDKDSITDKKYHPAIDVYTDTEITTREVSTDCYQCHSKISKDVSCGKDFLDVSLISREVNTEAPDIFVKSRGVCFRGPRKISESSQVMPYENSRDTACGRDYVESQGVSKLVNTDRQDYLYVDRSVDVLAPKTTEDGCQIEPHLNVVDVAVGECCHHPEISSGFSTIKLVKDFNVSNHPSFMDLDLPNHGYASSGSSRSSLVPWRGTSAEQFSTSINQVPREAIVALGIVLERGENLYKAMEIHRANLAARRARMERESQEISSCGTKEETKTGLETDVGQLQPLQDHGASLQDDITIIINDLLSNVASVVVGPERPCIISGSDKPSLPEINQVNPHPQIVEVVDNANDACEKNSVEKQKSGQFSLLSRNSLLTVVYGTVCSFVFWALQFSITCDSL